MKRGKLVELIGSYVVAYHNCERHGNSEWKAKHRDMLESLVTDFMPSGSGFDSGTKLDIDASSDTKLVFYTDYHHMNEGGFYDGWTCHKVTAKASFVGGFDLNVTGPNRNEIKDYVGECFHAALSNEIQWDDSAECYRYVS